MAKNPYANRGRQRKPPKTDEDPFAGFPKNPAELPELPSFEKTQERLLAKDAAARAAAAGGSDAGGGMLTSSDKPPSGEQQSGAKSAGQGELVQAIRELVQIARRIEETLNKAFAE